MCESEPVVWFLEEQKACGQVQAGSVSRLPFCPSTQASVKTGDASFCAVALGLVSQTSRGQNQSSGPGLPFSL